MKGKKIAIIAIIFMLIIIGIVLFISENNEQIANNVGNEIEENTVNQETEQEEFVENLDDGTKLNTSSKLKETKTVSGYEISNISLSTVNGQTFLTADIKNTSGRDKTVTGINITLYDKDGNELLTMGGVINELKNGETTKLESGTTLDFANAYDFKVTIQ